MTALAAGLLLGLAASGHCAVMCGPLMVALRSQTGRRGAAGIGLYHAGRVLVYAGLGAAAGAAGQAIVAGGFGRALSLGAGVVLLVMAAGRAGFPLPGRVSAGGVGRIVGRALAALRVHRAAHPAAGMLLAGGLNGLLPCGLLYGALVGAAGLARPAASAGVMVMYGLGTTPLLAAIWWSAGSVAASLRARVRLAAPLVLAVVGLLLIARGAGAPMAPAHGTAQGAHAHTSAAATGAP